MAVAHVLGDRRGAAPRSPSSSCRPSRARSSSWAAPYDAILTPALAQAPLRHGALDTSAPDPAATFRRSGEFTPFTAICNVTGQPAISLPLYARDDGLPLAVQLIGRPAGEGPLLALAAQLEAALPWSAPPRSPLGARADASAVRPSERPAPRPSAAA